MSDSPKNPYAAPATTNSGVAGSLPGTIGQMAMTGMIITGAMVMGLLVLTGIISFMTLPDLAEDQSPIRFDGESMLFLAIGYGLMIAGVVVALVLPHALKKNAASQLRASNVELPDPLKADSSLPLDAQKFLGATFTATLIGQALMEGPAVLNVILIMINENFAHAIPVLIGILGILLQMLTAGKLIHAMENAKMH